MNYLHFAALVCCITTLTASAADAPRPAARPPGVNESKWVAITETFGFVITRDVRTVNEPVTGEKRTPSTREPTVTGYFAVRREGIWCRANLEPSDGMVREL